MKKNLPMIIRVLISALFLLSAFAKLYPSPMYGITKIFEEGQLIPMGFSEGIAPYFSRFIIGIEFFIAFAILQRNYLKKLVIPTSVIMIFVFSLHLAYSIFLGDSENCGCFGELIPMSPLQALIKNIITICVLGFLYKNTPDDKNNSYSKLSIQFLSIMLLMFALLPVQTLGKNKRVSSFSEYVVSDIDINDGKKILCFFDAGCGHCEDAAKSLTQLSDSITNFPKMHIIFSGNEADKIPEFLKYAGKEYSYQVLPFDNDDAAINSYIEILGYDYENPAVIYLEDGNQVRFYDGTGVNAFPSTYISEYDDISGDRVTINDFTKAKEFKKLFE
jgi:thiol-disulfide isomerase/thioredoxin